MTDPLQLARECGATWGNEADQLVITDSQLSTLIDRVRAEAFAQFYCNRWTRDMSDAWMWAIPGDIVKAFSDLVDAVIAQQEQEGTK